MGHENRCPADVTDFFLQIGNFSGRKPSIGVKEVTGRTYLEGLGNFGSVLGAG